MSRLPIKLGKEPLIDAIFEIRFSSSQPASSLLLGHLFSKLEGEKNADELPAAQLPKAIRDSDPNMQFSPTHRLSWDKFFISFSDRSLIINTQYPYSGWVNFKPAIIKILNLVSELEIINSVDRFSMKYIDLVPAKTLKEQVDLANISLTVANHDLIQEQFLIRTEIAKDSFVNIVELIAGAKVELPNIGEVEGLVVSVDSILNLNGTTLSDMLVGFEAKLETIHTTNKTLFFDCLKPQTITNLEPIYE